MDYSLLIVDDEPDNLRILSSLLRDENQVIVAKSGEQALSIARDKQPDLILLDVVMPQLSGFEVIKTLKQNEQTADIPVIFITGLQSSKDETLGFELGAVDYIHKPFNPAIVKARVASQLKIIQQRKELENLSAELKEASEAKGMFLANMSHEIRTPLTTIIGYTESLLADEIGELEQNNALSIVNNSSKHLLSLVNDILDFSKIEAGELSIEILETDLNEIFEQVHIMCSELAKSKGLTLDWIIGNHLPSHIYTDPTRLKQILINLLSNAVKFTNKGNVSVEINSDEDQIRLSVVDDGIGIEKDKVANLFTSFNQVDNSTSRKYGGTGLGLSISQSLAYKLGGEITVKSEVGVGSIFTLTIPNELGEKAINMETLRFYSAYMQTTKHLEKFDAKVLLAEDHPENQKLFAMILTSLGLEVDTVDNGEMAVSACLEKEYDLVLMDIQMPIMSGLEAQKLIRTCGVSVPIIALTANVMKEEVETYLSEGFDTHLAKPLNRDELYKQLETYCRKSESAEPNSEFTEQVFLDLRQKFLNTFADYKSAFEEALRNDSFDLLAQTAHKFQGAARSFKFEREGATAEALEKLIYQANKSVDKTAHDLIRQLNEQIDNNN